MLTTALTWGRQHMAELSDKMQHSRHDARQLWLPITAVIVIIMAVVGGAVGIGMWLQRTNDRSDTTISLAAQLQAVDTKLSTLQGSVNVLIGMQESLSDLKSEVAALKKDVADAEREDRLFKDFVEGRIGSMPYRPSSTEGGSR